MYEVRIDDSASNDGKFFVLAGYIAHVDRWAAFENEWQALLDEEPSFNRFKMNEMARSGTKRARCESYYRVIERHVAGAISVVLRSDQLSEVLNNTTPPDGVKGWDKLKNPYYFAVRAIVQKLAMNQEEFGINGPIRVIFDSQTEQEIILENWKYMYWSVTPDLREKLDESPRFLTDEEDLPLQAADMWAWFVRRWEEKGNSKGIENLDFRSERFDWDAEQELLRINIFFGENEFRQEFDQCVANADSIIKTSRIIEFKLR